MRDQNKPSVECEPRCDSQPESQPDPQREPPGAISLEFALADSGIDATVTLGPGVSGVFDRPWLAITSSHLGKSTTLHREVCRYVGQAMIESRQSNQVLLVAQGSAIASWAIRAAELYGVPLIQVRLVEHSEFCSEPETEMEIRVCGSSLSRDHVVIALADRVDCVFVRKGGNIEASLRHKLAGKMPPCVRVAIHTDTSASAHAKTSRSLMAAGAIGWYCQPKHPGPLRARRPKNFVSPDWATTDGEWLVHCTRACNGAWPGQTFRQHQDELLLSSNGDEIHRTPLDSLRRILQTRRLIASAMTTCRKLPVVCLSEQPLQQLLSRRSYRSHLHRWDYEPYGLAIRKSAAISFGFQPVVYGDKEDQQQLSPADLYRYQSRGTTYDWTEEREWRSLGDIDLEAFGHDDIRVFVPCEHDAKKLDCPYGVSVVGGFVSNER